MRTLCATLWALVIGFTSTALAATDVGRAFCPPSNGESVGYNPILRLAHRQQREVVEVQAEVPAVGFHAYGPAGARAATRSSAPC